MIFGSFLSKLKKVELEDAEGNNFQLKNNFISKIGFKVIGIPHLGIRMRAKMIFEALKGINKKVEILDAGCGYGIFSIALKEKGYHVTPVDISNRRIYSLKKEGFTNVGLMDVSNLEFMDNTFDVIICTEVIEHIDDWKKALIELKRVLKKEGLLILTAPYMSNFNKKHYKEYGHSTPGYTTEEIIKETGMNLIEEKKYVSPLFEYMFKINKKLYKHNILLGLLFYPLYFITLLEGLIKFKEYNGLFLVLRK